MSSPKYARRLRAKAGHDLTLFSMAAHLPLAQQRAAWLRGVAGLAATPDGARPRLAALANSVVRGLFQRNAATGASWVSSPIFSTPPRSLRSPPFRRIRFAALMLPPLQADAIDIAPLLVPAWLGVAGCGLVYLLMRLVRVMREIGRMPVLSSPALERSAHQLALRARIPVPRLRIGAHLQAPARGTRTRHLYSRLDARSI